MGETTGTGRPTASGALRIIVADDNKDAADTLAQLLSTWGYEVRVAYDGLATLRLAQEYRANVGLLDLGLPSMDGYQVALHLRQRPEGKDMMLIAVTGHQWKDADRRSIEYGFDYHLVKPIDLTQLSGLLTKPKAS
jgi:CheY-like chemotaxis protein